ncbi:MAG: hypothetical protein RLZZ132_1405, partial [Bacteroidota bacterium]
MIFIRMHLSMVGLINGYNFRFERL